jgi:post-segregation antitoxin (ccd killing protein)
MRTKLTVTIDEDLLPEAKKQARSRRMSLSRLIESALRGLASEGRVPFSRRWRGGFRAANRKGARYAALAKKYL